MYYSTLILFELLLILYIILYIIGASMNFMGLGMVCLLTWEDFRIIDFMVAITSMSDAKWKFHYSTIICIVTQSESITSIVHYYVSIVT